MNTLGRRNATPIRTQCPSTASRFSRLGRPRSRRVRRAFGCPPATCATHHRCRPTGPNRYRPRTMIRPDPKKIPRPRWKSLGRAPNAYLRPRATPPAPPDLHTNYCDTRPTRAPRRLPACLLRVAKRQTLPAARRRRCVCLCRSPLRASEARVRGARSALYRLAEAVQWRLDSMIPRCQGWSIRHLGWCRHGGRRSRRPRETRENTTRRCRCLRVARFAGNQRQRKCVRHSYSSGKGPLRHRRRRRWPD